MSVWGGNSAARLRQGLANSSPAAAPATPPRPQDADGDGAGKRAGGSPAVAARAPQASAAKEPNATGKKRKKKKKGKQGGGTARECEGDFGGGEEDAEVVAVPAAAGVDADDMDVVDAADAMPADEVAGSPAACPSPHVESCGSPVVLPSSPPDTSPPRSPAAAEEEAPSARPAPPAASAAAGSTSGTPTSPAALLPGSAWARPQPDAVRTNIRNLPPSLQHSKQDRERVREQVEGSGAGGDEASPTPTSPPPPTAPGGVEPAADATAGAAPSAAAAAGGGGGGKKKKKKKKGKGGRGEAAAAAASPPAAPSDDGGDASAASPCPSERGSLRKTATEEDALESLGTGGGSALDLAGEPLDDASARARVERIMSCGSFSFIETADDPAVGTPASVVSAPTRHEIAAFGGATQGGAAVVTDGTMPAQHASPAFPDNSPVVASGIGFQVTSARRVIDKEAGTLSYWLYQSVLRTRLPMYEGQPQFLSQRAGTYFNVNGITELKCEKRYSDFEWLRKTLVASRPGVPVPPIPAKAASGAVGKVLDYFRADETQSIALLVERNPLVAERMHGLQLFLSYIGGSPALRDVDELRQFLLRSGEELAQYKTDVNDSLARGGARVPTAGNIAALSGWIKGLLGTGGVVGAVPADRMSNAIQNRRRYIDTLAATLGALLKEWDAWAANDVSHHTATASILSNITRDLGLDGAAPVALGGIVQPLGVGQRVVDTDGHRGVVRWTGMLEKAPMPDMTYIGVEWDAPRHGTSDGRIFGETKFVCTPGHASFVPPEVLMLEPADDADPLLTAIHQTCRQVEIALTTEDRDRANDIRMLRGLVRFWSHTTKEFQGCVEYIENLHATAIRFEAQGAADGRSPELAAVQQAIMAAEQTFYGEWEHFQQRWAEASAQIVRLYVKIMRRPPHPFFVSLTEWIDAVPAEALGKEAAAAMPLL